VFVVVTVVVVELPCYSEEVEGEFVGVFDDTFVMPSIRGHRHPSFLRIRPRFDESPTVAVSGAGLRIV